MCVDSDYVKGAGQTGVPIPVVILEVCEIGKLLTRHGGKIATPIYSNIQLVYLIIINFTKKTSFHAEVV